MHLFGGTEDGIYGAGLNALGAANALIFTDVGDGFNLFFAVFRIQRDGFNIQQVRQRINSALAARGIC